MKKSDFEKQQTMLRSIAAMNPLAAALMTEMAGFQRDLIETLAGESDVIEVNGLTMKKGPNGFEPVFDEDKH